MANLSGWLLASDIDGTALIEEIGVPPQNIEAVRRFIGEGGRFTFATGRSRESAYRVCRDFAVNAPMVVLNGSCVMDPQSGEFLIEHPMPPEIREATGEVLERMDRDHAVMLVTADKYWGVSRSAFGQRLCQRVLQTPICGIYDVKETIYKVLVISETPQEVPAMRQKLGEWYERDFTVVQSGETCVELLPKGVSKGSTLLEAAALIGVDRERIAAIGDNENDLEMLHVAALSAAPGSADEFVRRRVQKVLCPCMEGALAQLIEYLEEQTKE